MLVFVAAYIFSSVPRANTGLYLAAMPIYSETDCPRAAYRPPEPGEPPTIKSAGHLDKRIHIAGHVCLSVMSLSAF